MTLSELITDLKAAGCNDNTLKLALNCYELGQKHARNTTWTQAHWTEYEHSIAAAEREACADLCYKSADDNAFVNHYNGTRIDLLCSELIRARGKQ